MRQSQLFTRTKKDVPKGERFKNAQLLLQAGYIYKEMAGVYDLLPLGRRVFRNIENIIRHKMQELNGQEVDLTALQSPELWQKSGRWSDEALDVWFKTKLSNGQEVGLANTHEEPLTNILRDYVSSYRDLPVFAFQFQTKFRNELRAKSGLLRGREFLMKDLYSFTSNIEELEAYYEQVAQAYHEIFEEVGLGDSTYRTFASGGAFSDFSDEFQTLSEAGEDTIYMNRNKAIAVNKEIYSSEVLQKLNLREEDLEERRSIEVGNIFKLGTKYSEALGLTFQDAHGEENPVVMGSYGIGLGRLMAAVVEAHHDEAGLNWPANIAPFQVHLLRIGEEEEVLRESQRLYDVLRKQGIEVLFDDRNEIRGGEKMVEADLLGIPNRVVVSGRTVEQGAVELKKRSEGESNFISEQKLLRYLDGRA